MITYEIPIKSDEEGFILLKCNLCGEFFKLLASDLNDEANFNIWCPYCGLNGKNYYTDEVLDISQKIVQNEINKIIHQSFKDLERQTKNNKMLTFKCTSNPKDEIITQIKPKIENLEIKNYKCCKIKAKIRPISLENGSYCPLCGGADFE